VACGLWHEAISSIFRKNKAVISFRPYNLIIPIFKIEDMVSGGLKTIRSAFGQTDIQEDEYLVAIGLKNATEVRRAIEIVENLGIAYNDTLSRSDDFTILAKEGIWWPVAWLVNNAGSSWFIADVEAPV